MAAGALVSDSLVLGDSSVGTAFSIFSDMILPPYSFLYCMLSFILSLLSYHISYEDKKQIKSV